MQKEGTERKVALSNKAQFILIFLCWAVYTVAYVGRYSYTANGVPIMKYFQVNKDEFALATTFFFFAYGVGQILNGILCRRYNMKFMIAGALAVSAVINGLVFFGIPFTFIKYIWLANGICQSVFWASLLRILSCYLDEKNMDKAVIIMSTPVTLGTLLVYGLSSLFALFDGFKLTFLLAFVSMGAVAVLWFFCFPSITKKARLENLSSAVEKTASEEAEKQTKTGRSFVKSGILYMLLLFCTYAIVTNYVKDGLTTWIPQILNEQYQLDDSLSIILTLVLPVLGLCGAIFAVYINKFVKNHSDLLGVFFALSAVTVLGIQLLFKTDLWYLALLLFGLVSLFMNGANNVITNMFPLSVGKKYNSGMIAGLLNGACYVGSTLSQYVIALIAIAGDWSAVINVFFYLCIGITAFSVLMFLVRILFSKKAKR
jgi:OPA family glycerol-3-phosphate transporter-like MFS transporter